MRFKSSFVYHPVWSWFSEGSSVLVPECCRGDVDGEGYGTVLYHLDLNTGEYEEIRPLDGDMYTWTPSGFMWEVILGETPQLRAWRLRGSLREAKLEPIAEIQYEQPLRLPGSAFTRSADQKGILLFTPGPGSGILARENKGLVEMTTWSGVASLRLLRFGWGQELVVGVHRSRLAVFRPWERGLELIRERDLPFEVRIHVVAPDDSVVHIVDQENGYWLVDLKTLDATAVDGPFASMHGNFTQSPEGVRWLSGKFERFESSVSMETVLFLPDGEQRQETVHFPSPPAYEPAWSMVGSWAFWR